MKELMVHVEHLAQRRHLRAIAPDDLVGEVLLQVSKHRHEFHGRDVAEFLAWLIPIANFTIENFRRHEVRAKRATQRTCYLSEVLGEQSIADTCPGPCERIEECERNECLRRAVNRLDEQEARIVRARFYENLTLSEIAGRFHMSVSGIEKCLRRALTHLLYICNRYYPEGLLP